MGLWLYHGWLCILYLAASFAVFLASLRLGVKCPARSLPPVPYLTPMIARADYRSQDMPNLPGVYVFRDRFNQVIYVGKARSLRKRLANYFTPSRERQADPKLRSLINSIAYLELHPVRSEEESLLLESRLIKTWAPRYNILLCDDKRFLLIKLDRQAPFPRLTLARLKKDDGATYYGPFPLAGALRDTVDFLTRRFGLRSCKVAIPGEVERKHCHNHIVRDCSAPCVLKVTPEQYREQVARLVAVIDGDVHDLVVEVEERMRKHAVAQQFELASRMRDVAQNLKTVFGARNRTFVHAPMSQYPGPAGVAELGKVLKLANEPRVIECFDNSNIMGSFAVASMVCVRNGEPARQDYRHFRIKTVVGIDDFASMSEIVTRRYRRLLDEKRPLPDLVVVDGGLGQLGAAALSLDELGLAHLPLISLAKRQEEIFTLDQPEPILLERHQPALKLLQAIRDEAHRFAISFHRQLRSQRILDSLLDEIPGIGKTRREALLKAFGSVRQLRRQTAEEITAKVPGMGDKLAQELLDFLHKKHPETPAAPYPGTDDASPISPAAAPDADADESEPDDTPAPLAEDDAAADGLTP